MNGVHDRVEKTTIEVYWSDEDEAYIVEGFGQVAHGYNVTGALARFTEFLRLRIRDEKYGKWGVEPRLPVTDGEPIRTASQ